MDLTQTTFSSKIDITYTLEIVVYFIDHRIFVKLYTIIIIIIINEIFVYSYGNVESQRIFVIIEFWI